MNQTNIKNDAVENMQQQIISIDSSLETFISEAGILFKLLDNTSSAIRHFEKSMTELKAFFTFRLCIKSGKESLPKILMDNHKHIRFAEHFTTQVCWYLAWESLDENSKNYRLFLISDEQEIIHLWFKGDWSRDIQSNNISKKALIETDIQTRFEYVQYLNSFISQFNKHLTVCRLAIENNSNNHQDDFPF